MRAGRDNDWLIEDEKLLGLSLGADYCAEHERNIKELNQVLGIKNDESVFGIERRRVNYNSDCVNYNSDCVLFVKQVSKAGLAIMKDWELKYLKEKDINDWSHELKFSDYKEKDLATAWDSKSLGVMVRGEKYIGYLEKLHEALKNNDAAVWLGGGGPFQNSGLCVGIISNILTNRLQQMYDADMDSHNLQEASKAVGIKEKIDNLNKEWHGANPPFGYFSLHPAWATDKAKTKYKVMYWLNPMNQDKNDSNWFSVEQLELWLLGSGPVIKKKKEVSNV